ncbi:MAG: hypothetical protein GF334_08610 [Candidatus Altiarchaeales archaeon]|nr:hypothetical protein [Candidatus Altiarchaeales archaeon]
MQKKIQILFYLSKVVRFHPTTKVVGFPAHSRSSNPDIVAFSYRWIKKHSKKKPYFTVRLYPDSNEVNVKRFWAETLNIAESDIHTTRKSNSGRMAHRNWRSEYCVFSMSFGDTYLRAKIQALLDYIQAEWFGRNKEEYYLRGIA